MRTIENTCTQTGDVLESVPKQTRALDRSQSKGVLVAELLSREATSRTLFTMRPVCFHTSQNKHNCMLFQDEQQHQNENTH